MVGIIASLAGCGGIGTVAGPSSSVRANVNGDAFNYNVVGTTSQTPLPQPASTSGTATLVFAGDTYNGQAALQSTATTVITVAGLPKTLTETKQYSTAGVTLAQSDAGTLQAVTAGGFTKPETLSSSTTINGTETLANGTTITLQFGVVGTATITTAAGTFPCWTIVRTVTYSDGFTSNDTIEFAPLIGAPVQEVIRESFSNGFSTSLTTSLTSYTLGSG